MNTSFRLVTNLVKVTSRDEQGEYYLWHVRGEAMTPSGRVVQMDGSCTSRDEFFSMKKDENADPVRRPHSEIDEKDILATSETNAFNRCMSFLYGFGEVSADEMRGKQFASRSLTFPFGNNKGKEPKDLDAQTLHKELAFWERQAADPNNKFAAANAKLVNAIKEAIAEKTAKPVSGPPAGPSEGPEQPPGRATGPVAPEQVDLALSTDAAKTEWWGQVDEHLKRLQWTKARLTKYVMETYKTPDPRRLDLEQMKTLAMALSTMEIA